jgi:hypothetical protein
MKLISIDVGIKNLAYCVFDASNAILDWNVVNLMNAEAPVGICSCFGKKGIACNKKARYMNANGEQLFCQVHSKTCGFIMPRSLKSMKVCDLRQYAIDNNVTSALPSDLKSVILEKVSAQMLRKIDARKMGAGELDLVSIGRNMKTEFAKIEHFDTATHVVIENQISPIATRMKTVQGMIAQYFIMTHGATTIEFLSSAGKLKGFETQNSEAGSEYAKHKKDAVFHCAKLLDMEKFSEWKHVLDTKKKDDLADCFLQGIWYKKRNNILN